MKKINWLALITYLVIVGVSTFVGWWLIRVLYFFYLLIKAMLTI